jgi:hypothetical protein
MQFTKVHASIALTQLLPLQKRKNRKEKRETSGVHALHMHDI